MENKIYPLPLKAGDVLLNGQPSLVDCRVIGEELYQDFLKNFEIIVDLTGYNTFERSGKPYVIFRKFSLRDNNIGNKIGRITSEEYLFGKFIQNEDSEIIIEGELKSFESLQKAFNHAEKMQIEFF